MGKIFFCLIYFSMILDLSSCKESVKLWKNKEFESAINDYCRYLDTLPNYEIRNGFDYIFIEATQNEDITSFIITLSGGSYNFLNQQDNIKGFFRYKNYDILLLGDFPNEIVDIKMNLTVNSINEIVRKRYPTDYNKYLKDQSSVGPSMYDYMNLTLIFKGDILITYKRQIY
jgi:hypothetical protein